MSQDCWASHCSTKAFNQILRSNVLTVCLTLSLPNFTKSTFPCFIQYDIWLYLMSKWKTMHNSGETARNEQSFLNLHCLQKPLIAFGSERISYAGNMDKTSYFCKFGVKGHCCNLKIVFHASSNKWG